MTSLSGLRALLIGGSGFLGHHLMRACVSENMTVRVADMFAPAADAPDGIEFFQGDYRDPLFLTRIVEGSDFVVHLAHDTILLDVNHNMEIEFERNIRPAMRLMDTCCTLGVEKMLFVSSGGTVYGDPSVHEPIPEDARTHPISLYGTSKLMIEQMGFLCHAQKRLSFVVARPANAYGPGQMPFRGQGFVSTAFASALEGKSLSIFGDGSVVRDYVHARDIADALVALLQSGRPGQAYNVGTSSGMSLRMLLDLYIRPIAAADGIELRCDYSPARGADVPYNVLANHKLLLDTGFAPRVALKEGLQETWDWLKNRSPSANKAQGR